MKQKIISMTLGLLLFSVLSAAAVPVSGTFSGVISGGAISQIGGSFIYRPVGTPVTAMFSYDTDYLSAADAFGNRQDSFFDPAFYFLLLLDGSPFAAYANGTSPGADAMSLFKINADGVPVSGHGTGGFEIFFSPDSISLYQPPFDTLAVSANGTFLVPDSTATFWLLGLTGAGLVVGRHFSRGTLARKTARN
jgi:hypothetical protein